MTYAEAKHQIRVWEHDGRTTFDSDEVWQVIEALETALASVRREVEELKAHIKAMQTTQAAYVTDLQAKLAAAERVTWDMAVAACSGCGSNLKYGQTPRELNGEYWHNFWMKCPASKLWELRQAYYTAGEK